MIATDEIITRAQTAVDYLEDGARETGIKRLRELVNSLQPYRPVVDLATGREYEQVEIGGTMAAVYAEGTPWTLLEPTDKDGTFRAPDGSEWVGCTDGVWRRAS